MKRKDVLWEWEGTARTTAQTQEAVIAVGTRY